jgi:hypothetical protein
MESLMKPWGLVLIILAVLAAYFYPLFVMAHEFYDPWCCDGRDCAPYTGVVETTPEGFFIPEFNHLVPYNKARYDMPGDDPNEFHLCEYPKGTVRCFYVRPGGV